MISSMVAQCNPKARRSKEERGWLNDKATGGELL
jgi:hypothetical protein